MAFVGTGITISGGPNGFLAEILDVTPPSQKRDAIPSWHQLSTQKTTIPGKVLDIGELQLELAWKGNYPVMDEPGQYTVTFPASGTPSLAFHGYIMEITPKAPIEQRSTASVKIKVQSIP